MNAMFIGIAGGTGSGKSTLTKRIAEALNGSVSVIYYDSYYKPHSDMSLYQRARLNFDHPDSLDSALLVQHLKELRKGNTVECPVYDFVSHTRLSETVTIAPARIVIVDGMLIFCEQELREQFDMKLYVDTDADIRILRRLVRDVSERGRSMESVIEQYISTVKPMHEQFTEPSKRYADLIIPEGGQNDVAADVIIRAIKERIEGTVTL